MQGGSKILASKLKPFYRCNASQNFGTEILGLHDRKFATGGYIVSPPSTVSVTALVCIILITTLPMFVHGQC